MFGLGFQELVIVGIVALLLFGKRLPDVAKSLGHSYREFRKGLADIQSTINYDTYRSPTSSHAPTSRSSDDEYDDYDEPTAPKFEPPPVAPQPARDDPEPTGDISKPIAEK